MPHYRFSEAARLLGVSDDTVRRWVDAGHLDAGLDASGRKVVDGAVNGAARLTTATAGQVRRAQTGNVRNYAGIVGVGVVLLLLWLSWSAPGMWSAGPSPLRVKPGWSAPRLRPERVARGRSGHRRSRSPRSAPRRLLGQNAAHRSAPWDHSRPAGPHAPGRPRGRGVISGWAPDSDAPWRPPVDLRRRQSRSRR